ncbi:MAG: hypothetical protein EOM69_10625, partial [Clostridia bacterium]|nr:hypothetical protein [Clostridia bacterium]
MPELQSTLYSPKAALVSLLERFIEDLLDVRAHWREKLENVDAEAEKALYIRTMAAYGLFASKEEAMIRGFACEEKQVSTADLCQNPLIRELLPQGVAIPAVIADMTQTTYYFETVPFARRSATYLLEPSNYPGESETLALLGKEIALLDEHSEAWNRHMGERLASLAAELSCQVGAGRRVIDLLMRWSSDHLRYQPSLEHELVVEDRERQPQTLSLLLNDLLGMQTRSAPLAFSDRLLLLENCAQPPFAEEAFNKRCALQGRYAVPPLHPWISSFLMRQETEDELSAARLAPESLSFETRADGGVRVSFELRRRKQHQAATQVGAARFSRVYSAEECVTLHGEELPYIVLWPCVRMAKGLWKNYYVYAHRPEQLDVWVLQDNAWVQGVERYALAPDGGVRTWQTAVTSEYPSFLLLKRGALSLGALPAVVHRTQLKHESPAVIGMDFGSIATTTMMRQGERVLPAIYPQRLHRALLNPRAGDEKYLCDELLP